MQISLEGGKHTEKSSRMRQICDDALQILKEQGLTAGLIVEDWTR